MRSICSRLATAALVSAGAVTAIGYLAPWWPKADVPNQFTPFILVAAVVGLALLAYEWRKLATHRLARLALAVGLSGMAAINTASLLTAQATAAVAEQGPTETLTVVSFNVWTKNQRLDEVSHWLLNQNADVIVVQEMSSKNRDPIKRALAASYPHVYELWLQRHRDVLATGPDRCRWSAAHSRAAGLVVDDVGRSQRPRAARRFVGIDGRRRAG
jgi:endonuclease/exonuclease/phosphatase (EEP) superfamily protein YafD